MMDLRVSVVLLLIFLTGGYSLKCYKCSPNLMGSCDKEDPETCPYEDYKCGSRTKEISYGSTEVTSTTRGCIDKCVPGRQKILGVTLSVQCCSTDLCNEPGFSLKCYKCTSDSKGVCDGKEQTCPAGDYKCASTRQISYGSTKVSSTTKGCEHQCEDGTQRNGMTTTCCDTDLCNAAGRGVATGGDREHMSPTLLETGFSLKCYMCESDSMGFCDAKEQTCPAGDYKCASSALEMSYGYTEFSFTTKGCEYQCKDGTQHNGMTTTCCDTDLCNAADGMYKGSFLLLFSPLLFYFLFQ